MKSPAVNTQSIPDLYFRKKNVIGPRLTDSTCVFYISLSPQFIFQPTDHFLNTFEDVGGRIQLSDSGSEKTMILTINHSLMDAFGGLFVASKSQAIGKSILSGKYQFNDVCISYDGYSVQHRFKKSSPISSKEGPTFTQRFLGELISKSDKDDTFDICVSCDNIKNIDLSAFTGNSLGIVKASSKRLVKLVTNSRTDWMDFLSKRALRSLIESTNDEMNKVAPGNILISSLGNINNIPWISGHLSPSNFIMIPTPALAATNVVMWSANGLQAITVCRQKNQSSDENSIFSQIFRAWDEVTK